jgi:hypothetical protein
MTEIILIIMLSLLIILGISIVIGKMLEANKKLNKDIIEKEFHKTEEELERDIK